MRLKLLLEATEDIVIPWSYRSDLTRLVYGLVGLADKDYASWLYNKGYVRERKVYRMFCYSDLECARFEVSSEGFKVRGSMVWQLTSPDENFIKKLMSGINILSNKLEIFGSKIEVLDAIETRMPSIDRAITFHTISPIVVSKQDKGKGSPPLYLSPQNHSFTESIERNLLFKWEAFNGKPIEQQGFQIRVWDPKSKLVPIFNIKVRAWHLKLQMWGSDELVRFAYDTGLGERNSQGFGMIEVGG
ncbi:MAG: CRISPR-associated endoribonuclease Cas6 [Nitrososphaerales archaeon]